MKLKTSFFKNRIPKFSASFLKPETLRKDVLRFAPIWGLYLLGMLMVMLESGSYYASDTYARNMLAEMLMVFGVINLLYAGLCANALFGDLYNTKLCYSLHAMPYRRESWLLTHLIAGLLFSMVPNAAICVYMMNKLQDLWYLALYWYLAVTLQFIFFYGVATVSAMLTGNRFAMLLVYAGFNFVAMLLYATVNVIYIPMLTGVVVHLEDYSRFSPAVQLFNYEFFAFERVADGLSSYGYTQYRYDYVGLSTGWGYTAILAGVGVAAMLVSFWLYRIRQLECAGDFIAFPKLKWLACVVMTLCVALCFALVGDLFGSYVLWLIVGLIVGYFGSLMLLERRLKVFRKQTITAFGILAIGVVLSLTAVNLDWFGIESWTPKASSVSSVTVANGAYSDAISVEVTDQADIAKIVEAHKEIYQAVKYNNKFDQTRTIVLTYKMKSGRTVIRRYYVPPTNSGYITAYQYLFNADSILGYSDPQEAAKYVQYMYSSYGQIRPELYEKLLIALQTDCFAGYVTTEADSKYDYYYISYRLELADGTGVYRDLLVDDRASNVLGLFSTPEFAMGYSDWSSFIASVQDVGLTGLAGDYANVPADQWESLLSALRKDIAAGTVSPIVSAGDSIYLYYSCVDSQNNSYYREFSIPQNAEAIWAWIKENTA